MTNIDYSAVLASASKVKAKRAPIILLYGTKKQGKTTWAAAFPKAVFLCGEDGAHAIADVRMPSEGKIESWEQLLTYTRALAYGPHDFQTVVADTLGPLSSLCLEQTVKDSGKPSWEKMSWGKEEDLISHWRVWLALLEHCRNKRGMTVVLLAHAAQVSVQDSQHGEKYYVWAGDMHRAIWSQTSNWADMVLYTAPERVLHEPENGHIRAIATGPRWIYAQVTQQDGGFEAGVRAGFRLPAKLALSYEAFSTELSETPERVRMRIATLAASIGPEVVTKAEEFMKVAGDNVVELRVIEKKLQEIKR